MASYLERRRQKFSNQAAKAMGKEIPYPDDRAAEHSAFIRRQTGAVNVPTQKFVTPPPSQSKVALRPTDPMYGQFSSSGTPTGTATASPITLGGTMSGLFSKAGMGSNLAGALGSAIGGVAGTPDRSIVPIGGKGGGAVAPAAPSPTQGQFAPLAPQGGFNINQAAAGALQQAMAGTQAGMGFQAPRTTAVGYNPALQQLQGMQTGFGYDPAQRRAFTLAGSNIAQYESPYQQAVIDRTLQDLSGAQEKALNVLGQQATASRAFGGSRQALEAAETRRKYAEQAAETVANLRERGFQQALGAAQFDVGQLAGTEAANIAAQQAAQQFGATSAQAAQAANIQRAQQVAAANAAAQTAASQFGATAAQQAQQQNFANQLAALGARQGAASQLAGLGQQAFQTGQTIQQQQAQQGLLQQGLQQALIDAARGQYAGYVGSPSAALQAPLAALGVTPVPQSTTQSYSPGLFDYLKYPLMGLAR